MLNFFCTLSFTFFEAISELIFTFSEIPDKLMVNLHTFQIENCILSSFIVNPQEEIFRKIVQLFFYISALNVCSQLRKKTQG